MLKHLGNLLFLPWVDFVTRQQTPMNRLLNQGSNQNMLYLSQIIQESTWGHIFVHAL